ncbi:MAG: Zn-dependent oxidoreductase, NADPH:quinone reductase [Mesorhizobium sp.]|nr:MAG: Zn-dependent oxidoreductase, NADPH:quinone reductase [Mesorhizobium sp.]
MYKRAVPEIGNTAGQPASLVGRAVVLTRHGGSEALELRQWETPPPEPRQVRLRVEAAGISFADLLVCQGLHPERRPTPHVPGWDVVGIVESVGSEIRHVRVGQRIACLSIVGGWAEHAVVPGEWVVPVPATVTPTLAVCLVMDYVVAYQMLTRSTSIKTGDTVLLQGAGGGVGTAFMQIARQLGVRVLGTDRAAKRAHIEAEGGVLIDFEHEDVPTRCRELTDGRGVAYGYDGIGATATASLRSLHPGGRLVWFGMVTLLSRGERHRRGSAWTAWKLALAFAANLLPGGKRTSLYSIQTLARRHPEWYREDLAALMAMLAEGKLSPRIANVRTLEQVPSALGDLAGRGPPGKQVIAVGPQ